MVAQIGLTDTHTTISHWTQSCCSYTLLFHGPAQGLVKGAKLCFRYPYFNSRHGESTSTASQLTSPASQKSKDLNKLPLLLQDLVLNTISIPSLVNNWHLVFFFSQTFCSKAFPKNQFLTLDINIIKIGRNPLIIFVGFNCQLIRYKLRLIARYFFNELLP